MKNSDNRFLFCDNERTKTNQVNVLVNAKSYAGLTNNFNEK